jgi:hypothetical protein
LIDVDALRESDRSQEIEQQQRPASPVTSARNELDQIKKEGREDWFRQRERKGKSLTLEEIRTKGRDQDARSEDLSGAPGQRAGRRSGLVAVNLKLL